MDLLRPKVEVRGVLRLVLNGLYYTTTIRWDNGMQYTVYCYSEIEVFAMCWCSHHDFGASILLFGIRFEILWLMILVLRRVTCRVREGLRDVRAEGTTGFKQTKLLLFTQLI